MCRGHWKAQCTIVAAGITLDALDPSREQYIGYVNGRSWLGAVRRTSIYAGRCTAVHTTCSFSTWLLKLVAMPGAGRGKQAMLGRLGAAAALAALLLVAGVSGQPGMLVGGQAGQTTGGPPGVPLGRGRALGVAFLSSHALPVLLGNSARMSRGFQIHPLSLLLCTTRRTSARGDVACCTCRAAGGCVSTGQAMTDPDSPCYAFTQGHTDADNIRISGYTNAAVRAEVAANPQPSPA